ncbi:MAG TPA: ArsA-related P-loop ATPase [Ilumatobacteraceae bacterium]|nr:ArsA-related P-loop ATPase [Ilumatobacteraceae bacterium]
MAAPDWLTSTRVAIVAGKGGVGSSTVAAAYALAAAREGANVLYVAVDGRPGMGPLLGGRELDSTDRILRRIKGAGQVRGRTIPADQAFGDYLELKGVSGMLRRAASAASLPMIAAATPGLEHLLVLGKIKELERERAADLIIVDAPPAGNAAPFLRSATGLSDVVQSGPVREQSVEVDAMLRDPARCLAMVVTLPEETPVTEALQLADEMRADIGLSLLPAVVNGCWTDRPGLLKTPAMAARSHKITLSASAKAALASSTDFGRERLELQRHQIDRLADGIGVPLITLPRLATPRLTIHHLGELADALVGPMIGGAA